MFWNVPCSGTWAWRLLLLALPCPRLPSHPTASSLPLLGFRSFTATSTATSSPSSWSTCCQTTSPSPQAPSCWVSGCLGQAGRTEACTPEPLAQLQAQPLPQLEPRGQRAESAVGLHFQPPAVFRRKGQDCGCEGLGCHGGPFGDGATQRRRCTVAGLQGGLQSDRPGCTS